jgi:uncharacterized protein (DUF1501 family)
MALDRKPLDAKAQADHVRVADKALATAVFPGSAEVKPMAGLVG